MNLLLDRFTYENQRLAIKRDFLHPCDSFIFGQTELPLGGINVASINLCNCRINQSEKLI